MTIDQQQRAALQLAVQSLSEAELTVKILDYARATGWDLRYHPYRSTKSKEGWPDWVFVNVAQHRVVFIELKGYGQNGDRGQASKAQQEWLDALRQCGQEAYLWSPDELADGTIWRVLRGVELPLIAKAIREE